MAVPHIQLGFGTGTGAAQPRGVLECKGGQVLDGHPNDDGKKWGDGPGVFLQRFPVHELQFIDLEIDREKEIHEQCSDLSREEHIDFQHPRVVPNVLKVHAVWDDVHRLPESFQSLAEQQNGHESILGTFRIGFPNQIGQPDDPHQNDEGNPVDDHLEAPETLRPERMPVMISDGGHVCS